MNFLWDTNILVHYLRDSETYKELNAQYLFWAGNNRLFISIVSAGEIYSLAYQRNWGPIRMETLKTGLESITAIPLSRKVIVDNYAKIDAYSQGKWRELALPAGMTARNMGKNDLWIAATAHTLQANLVTTDPDFDHLHGQFLNIIRPVVK